MADELTKDTLDRLMVEIASIKATPSHIIVGAVQYAGLKAHIDWQGRDRRRIKREVRKAMDKAHKANRGKLPSQYRVNIGWPSPPPGTYRRG